MRPFVILRPWFQAVVLATFRAAWAPVSIVAVHVIGSKFVPAYHTVPAVDIPMHFLGGLAIAFFLHRTLRVFISRRLVRPVQLIVRVALLFGLVCTAAVCWEFVEYGAAWSRGLHGRMTLHDTLLDLLVGMVGGAVYLTTTLRARA